MRSRSGGKATATPALSLIGIVTALPARLTAVPLADLALGTITALDLTPSARIATGLVAGVGIGAAAALMGVAGRELDVKLAGSLSLAVSLPRSARRPSQPSASRSAACRLGSADELRTNHLAVTPSASEVGS